MDWALGGVVKRRSLEIVSREDIENAIKIEK
jgi:hypothetical protein